MRDYPTFLILAVFLASGVSFFDGLAARVFVRLTTVIVGIVAGLALTVGVLIAFAFSPDWTMFLHGSDALHLIGSSLLILHFFICVLTCVPLGPALQVRKLGLVLHFVVMPAGFFLTTFSALVLPWDFRLGAFTHNLSLGLIYAMLWFRMLEKQRAYRPLFAQVK